MLRKAAASLSVFSAPTHLCIICGSNSLACVAKRAWCWMAANRSRAQVWIPTSHTSACCLAFSATIAWSCASLRTSCRARSSVLVETL